MPPLTRWYIRLAFGYLVLALLTGTAAAARQPLGLPPIIAAFGPVAVHLFVVGWITQMIFGVAYWMFPRVLPGRSFGSPVLGWTAFAGLNAGLLLRAGFEPWAALRGSGPWTGVALAASALFQLAAVLGMVALLWRRVAER